MTTLQEGQTLRRVIRVYGVEQPVVVEITSSGIRLRVQGTMKAVTAPWPEVVKACATPHNVKCYHANMPLMFLQDTAKSITKKRVAALDNKGKK